MAVPYTFSTATSSIPLSQLDGNFATPITLGNTSIQLGNTVTTLNNMTLTNVTISSVASTFPNNFLGNSTATLGNSTITLGSTTSSVGNLTLVNANITSGTYAVTDATVSGTLTLSGGTANGVGYLNASKQFVTGSALTFDGTNLGIGLATPAGYGISPRAYVQQAADTAWKGLVIGAASSDAFLGVYYDGSVFNYSASYGSTAGYKSQAWQVGGSEQMRLTSKAWMLGYTSDSGFSGQYNAAIAGNLGLGTASPNNYAGYKTFTINGTNGGEIDFQDGGTTRGQIYSASTGMTFTTLGAIPLYLGTNGTTKATLDSSGNLGLGVTPSAWGTGASVKGFQMPGVSLWGYGGTNAYLNANAYYNGTNRIYTGNGYATEYEQSGGNHVWKTAPSGTAGAAITFTQAMTLDASGRLGIGTTSPGADLSIGDASTTASRQIRLHGPASGTAGGASVNVDNGTNVIFAAGNASNIIGGAYSSDAMLFWGNAALRFYGNSNELARIDSSGNLLVGTTSTGANLGTNSAIVGSYGPVFKSTGGAGFEAGDFWNASTTGDAYFVYWRTEAGGTIRGSVNYNRSLGLTSYNTTSDRRAKDILGPVTNSGETIDAIQVHIGQMHGATQSRPMFIADELQGPAPYCVTGEKNAVNEKGEPVYQQVDHSPLIPLLVAEIQSLRKRLAAAGIA